MGILPAVSAQVAGVQPAANPAFPDQCGLDVAVVVDTSASITDPNQGGDAANPGLMKAAAKQFVESLQGTPSASRRRSADFWIDMADKKLHIRYFAVHGPQGDYLGCLETVQDITAIQKLSGQQRLLD